MGGWSDWPALTASRTTSACSPQRNLLAALATLMLCGSAIVVLLSSMILVEHRRF
jgi:hypothetical protein